MIARKRTYALPALGAAILLTANAFGQQVQAPAELYVAVDPADASISVNRQVQPVAPLSLRDLAPGEYLVTVGKIGYKETRRTVVLLPGQREALQIKLEPLTGLVLVHSQPSDADVLIDGAHRGKTPLLLTDLRLGDYRLQVSRQGFRVREVDLSITDRTPQMIRMSLMSDTAALRIASTPAGARIRLNGLDRGVTPKRIANIPEGQAAIEVELAGHLPYKETVRVVAGEDRDLAVILRPVPSKLSLVTIPVGARIYVNDEFRGASPVALENLAPGSYRVRAEMEGHATMARTVNLPLAAERVEEFRLQANVGSLRIVTTPPGIEVLIDGKAVGVTKGEDVESLPMTIDNIPIGKRSVILRARDRHEKRFEIVVERGQTVAVRHELQRKFAPDYEIRTSAGVVQGVLVEIRAGHIRMEIAPGVFRNYEPGDYRSHRPLH
jgi:hypothetical protein